MFLSHCVYPEWLFQTSLAILQRLIMVFRFLLNCRCPADNTSHCHQSSTWTRNVLRDTLVSLGVLVTTIPVRLVLLVTTQIATSHCVLCGVQVGKVRRCCGKVLFAQVTALCFASNWHFGWVWGRFHEQPCLWPRHCCSACLLDWHFGASGPLHSSSCPGSQPYACWEAWS